MTIAYGAACIRVMFYPLGNSKGFMKKINILLIVFLLLFMQLYGFDIQAHRGGRDLYPENTMAAFRNAIELGVTTLELDLAMTKDGVIVISHDPYLSYKLIKNNRDSFISKYRDLLKISLLANFRNIV